MMKMSVLKKIAFFFIFIFSLIFLSCSSGNNSESLSTANENLFFISQKIEDKTVWTREVEAVRLIQDITKEEKILSIIQLKPSVINISNLDFPPVFPVLDGFSSLDLSQTPDNLISFIKNVSDSVLDFSLSKIKTAKAGTESLIFFQEDLKNGYENYFSLKFPEYTNQNEDEKSGAREKIFSNYVIGNPVSRENIIIALVRFYKSESFMDVQMYIENNDDFKLSQIRILQWQK